MATTLRTNLYIPEILETAVKGQLAGMRCLKGSGAAIVKPGLPGDKRGGNVVTVPYFGNLGDLEDVAENVALTPVAISQSSETATVQRAGKAFEATFWADNAAAEDPHAEAARQIREAVERRADQALIEVACAAGLPSGQSVDVYNSSSPVTLAYDRVIDARMAFGDEDQDLAAICMHSKVVGDLLKLKDGEGRPLMQTSGSSMEGLSPAMSFAGVPIIKSDRCPVEFPAFTSTGTTPPATVGCTGSTTRAIKSLTIDIVVGGTTGTATFRYSYDGGATWSATVATAATVALLRDGMPTGLTATFGSGTFNADNLYTGVPKFTTILARRNALAFWYAASPRVRTDSDILTDKDLMSVNIYFAAHRYSRLPGSVYSGIVLLRHN